MVILFNSNKEKPPMHNYLKVKIMSLAAEAKIIRQQERQRIRKAKYARDLVYLQSTIARLERRIQRYQNAKPVRDFTYLQEELMRLKRQSNTTRVTSLSVQYHETIAGGLHQHRIVDVRQESRIAQLAYGFLKGKPYDAIEQNVYYQPDWKRVEELVMKYGEDDPDNRAVRFQVWKTEALSGKQSGRIVVKMKKLRDWLDKVL